MTHTIDLVSNGDLEDLVAFAEPFQQDALAQFPALLHPGEDALLASFQKRMEYGTGVVAREQGNIVGILLGIGPFDHFRPNHRGVYSPLCSCLTSGVDQDRLFTDLLTEYGKVPANAGVQIASITAFPHNQQLNFSLMQNGFGIRCVDSIARISDLPEPDESSSFSIEQVAIADAVELREVKHLLATHLASSPVYQELFDFSPEFIAQKSEERQSIHFAARDGDRVIGFIEATFEGENYLTRHPQMRNICGAGVLPEYRNRGVMRALLAALVDHCASLGVTTIGVDYESQNPEARAFWERYFTPYTWSWERHFDRPWGPL